MPMSPRPTRWPVLAELGIAIDKLNVAAEAPDWYHPGRSGVLKLGRTVLAHFGALRPRVLDAMDAGGPMVAFEVLLDALPGQKRKATRARPPLDLAILQPVRRDFAFVVDRAIPALDIVRAAARADQKLVTGVRVFDVFEGAKFGADRKSGSPSRSPSSTRANTLTDEAIETVSQGVVAGVEKATGAVLRG